MKVLYTLPSLQTVYAARFVYEGLKNAFIDLGHKFRAYTSDDNLKEILATYQPDVFFYSLNFYHLKFINLNLLKKYRKKGLIVFCQIRAWQYLDYVGGLKYDKKQVDLIKRGLAGDIFWHCFEQDEPLMEGFTKETGYKFKTIHQAADKIIYYHDYDKNLVCDLAYVGSFLPAKSQFMKKNVLPLKDKYDLRIYGSDWTFWSRCLGKVQKFGQYFNIDFLKRMRKIHLSLNGERKLYSSAKICLNVHEEQVKKYDCEINERTFKIMACGGFELCDNVKLLQKFFTEKELVIAEDSKDWFEKIDYYLKHPKERKIIAEAGRKKVLAEHTYHNRVRQIIDICLNFKKYGK